MKQLDMAIPLHLRVCDAGQGCPWRCVALRVAHGNIPLIATYSYYPVTATLFRENYIAWLLRDNSAYLDVVVWPAEGP